MDIYIGNLPFEVTESEVQELFSGHGQVESVKIITDKETGESRGFGFIKMPNQDEAQAAIRTLNGSDFRGKKLTINEARPRQPNANGHSFQRRPGGGNRDSFGSNRGPRSNQSYRSR